MVRPEWVDYNGHMSDFIYGHVFGEAMDALYRGVGLDEAYRNKGRMFYTVESHVRHLGEAKVNEPLYVTTQVLALDEKRLHMFHRLYRGRDDALIATGEQMHLHVDTAAAKATPMDRGAAAPSSMRCGRRTPRFPCRRRPASRSAAGPALNRRTRRPMPKIVDHAKRRDEIALCGLPGGRQPRLRAGDGCAHRPRGRVHHRHGGSLL